MQVGKTENIACYLSTHAANRHVSATGMSGSGKTARLNQLELDAVKDGETVLVFDINKSHAAENVFLPVRGEYESYVNRIEAKFDGIGIRFLQPIQGKNGRMEDYVDVISSTTNVLGMSQRMGSRQIGVLREAELYAMRHIHEFSDEMSAIKAGILQMDCAVANAVYQKLWTLIHSNIFRKSDKKIMEGKINIISFWGIDKIMQATLVEIILSYLWRSLLISGNEGEMVLVIDEYQNILLGEGSALRTVLREGRKFGLGLLLATQTLNVFDKATRSVINQAATRLYFKPEANEIRNIAKEIDPENIQRWMRILQTLKRGEAVAVGEFSISNREVSRPVLTRW